MVSIIPTLFTFPPTVYNGSFPPASLPALVICFLDDFHFDWGEMEPQGHFDLNFLYE
jgi:hypothetical protein